MAEKTKYLVKDPVDHNKKRYEPGDSLALSEEEAAPLLTLGAIEAPAVEEKAKK